jgi:hypothetical protein
MVSVDTLVLGARDERDIPKASRWFRPNLAAKHGDLRELLDALLEVVPQPA